MTRNPERIFFVVTAIALIAGWHFYRSPLLLLFIISFASDFHAAAMIQLKARRVLDSWEWQVMFTAIGVSLGLTATALFLSLFPQFQGPTATVIWFTGFTLKRIMFAVGFRRHVLNVIELFVPGDYALDQQRQAAYTAPNGGMRALSTTQSNSAKLDNIKEMLADVQQGTPPIPVVDEAVLKKLDDVIIQKLDTIQESADAAAADNPDRRDKQMKEDPDELTEDPKPTPPEPPTTPPTPPDNPPDPPPDGIIIAPGKGEEPIPPRGSRDSG